MAEFPAGLRQPDQRSCGAACLVVAQGLRDAAYRQRVTDPATFRTEVLAMHGRITSAVDVAGRIQPPWPRMFGTPPWAVARQLEGMSGVPHDSVLVRGGDLGAAYARLVGLPRPAALYVGNGWLPRHVVLVLKGEQDEMRVYEPAGGRVTDVTRSAFTGRRTGLGGWDDPWFAVLPSG